jgi:hypothetical protein
LTTETLAVGQLQQLSAIDYCGLDGIRQSLGFYFSVLVGPYQPPM